MTKMRKIINEEAQIRVLEERTRIRNTNLYQTEELKLTEFSLLGSLPPEARREGGLCQFCKGVSQALQQWKLTVFEEIRHKPQAS